MRSLGKLVCDLNFFYAPPPSGDHNITCVHSSLLVAVNKAYRMFDDEEQLQYIMGVAEEARETLDAKLEEKRKAAKAVKKESIEEDDPVIVRHLLPRQYTLNKSQNNFKTVS